MTRPSAHLRNSRRSPAPPVVQCSGGADRWRRFSDLSCEGTPARMPVVSEPRERSRSRNMGRRTMRTAAALAALALLGAAALGPAQEKGDGWVRLFNGKDFTGWRKFVDPKSNADPDQVWTVQDGIIVCAGRPNGYLITEKEYGDFVLRVQWRWGKTAPARGGRNSGVFVWVTGQDKIWPKGVEAQLFSGSAGDIWLVGDFKLQVDP